MSIEIDVNIDQSVAGMTSSLVETVESAIAISLGREGYGSQRGASVSVLLTCDDQLRRLNRDFASNDEVTDVLSFGGDHKTSFPENLLGERDDHLGDIAISVEQTARQAAVKGWNVDRELAMLAIHGALHLLGYDHAEPDDERVMFGKTDAALDVLFGEDSGSAR